jgi:hypothetical protein
VLIPALISKILSLLGNISFNCSRVTERKKVCGEDSGGFSAHLPSVNTTFKRKREKRKGGENKSDGVSGGSYIPGRRIFVESVNSFPDPT